jgi:hypothetical protein
LFHPSLEAELAEGDETEGENTEPETTEEVSDKVHQGSIKE